MTGRALAILLTLASPTWAERAVTPDEFDALVSGQTLRFDRGGVAYGAEQYFRDRRVIWAFEDDSCQRGIWFANPRGEICFVYDDDPAPQCWRFLEMPGGGFHARPVDAGPEADLVAREWTDEPLECPLPDLGV